MKRLVTTIAAVVFGMAVYFGGSASAGLYPVIPPGTFVTLQPEDFIQSVPEQSPGLPTPNPVIGDNLSQHPGAFGIGFPPVDTYFVGVFGGSIDTSKPDAAVYLWETTAPDNGVAFPGPQIQLGYWDGMVFTTYGISQAASYSGTGIVKFLQTQDYEINSSITPLSDFEILPGFPYLLNAVRIEAVDEFAHNQVIAVVSNVVVPEPSTIFLICAGLAGVGFLRWNNVVSKKR